MLLWIHKAITITTCIVHVQILSHVFCTGRVPAHDVQCAILRGISLDAPPCHCAGNSNKRRAKHMARVPFCVFCEPEANRIFILVRNGRSSTITANVPHFDAFQARRLHVHHVWAGARKYCLYCSHLHFLLSPSRSWWRNSAYRMREKINCFLLYALYDFFQA